MSIKAYKGFDKDLRCRGFRYEVGKEYETDKAKLCECGFHACEEPLNVLEFYPLENGNRYCEVEQSGDIDQQEGKNKTASTKIRINTEIGIAGLVKAQIDFVFEKIGKIKELLGNKAARGNNSKLATSGNNSQLAARGNNSQLAASGNNSKLATSGNYSQLAASGDFSQLATSGDNSKLATSGDYSQLATSGDNSKLATSGNNNRIESIGNRSVIANIGYRGKVKAKAGTWVTLAEYGSWCEDENGRAYYRPCLCVKSFRVSKKQEDKWLEVKDGEVVEVE